MASASTGVSSPLTSICSPRGSILEFRYLNRFRSTVEPFTGTNWEECNTFIRAIRTAAAKAGKTRDLAWTADFASLHLSHKALTWYSRLPQDVRDDWAKLQAALLERWTPSDDDDQPRIVPTPAAAPPLNLTDRADRPLEGVLKLGIKGSKKKNYFKLGTGGCGVATDKAKDAYRFRCSSLSNATILERIDGSRHSWLAIQWGTSKPNLKKGSADNGYLVFVDSLTLKTSRKPNTPYQLASCTRSTGDEVILGWENEDTSKIAIGIFRNSHGNLFVAADPDAYSRRNPGMNKVKIFIQSID